MNDAVDGAGTDTSGSSAAAVSTPARPVRRKGIGIRLKLTLTYGALSLVASAGLLAVVYVTVQATETNPSTAVGLVCRVEGRQVSGLAPPGTVPSTTTEPGADPAVAPSPVPPSECATGAPGTNPGIGLSGAGPTGTGAVISGSGPTVISRPVTGGSTGQSGTAGPDGAGDTESDKLFVTMFSLAQRTQGHTLHTLLVNSGFALAVMTVVSLLIGWLLSARVLRPVLGITHTARQMSQDTLDRRIDYRGPNDELAELADTFDAMLGRLEAAFTSQRHFLANASHELRTPLATGRVLVDEALAHPAAGDEALRATLQELRQTNVDSEQLLDALLTLARSERGLDRHVRLDLAELAADAISAVRSAAETAGMTIAADLASAPATGDAALLRRLIDNLLDNAVKHSSPGPGTLAVSTARTGISAVFSVENSGPVIAVDAIPQLFEPFVRGPFAQARVGPSIGLGLTIVRSIVQAHAGDVIAQPRVTGGLRIIVTLPASP